MTMSNLAFYDVGTESRGGLRRVIILPRRLLRRILRPCFFRLTEILQALVARLDAAEQADRSLRADIDQLARQQAAMADAAQTAMALGWDHVALARRLAILEDRVEFLTRLAEADLPEPGGPVLIAEPNPAEHGPHFRVG
jgi:hypothetical protein